MENLPKIILNGQELQPSETIKYVDGVEVSREKQGTTYLEQHIYNAMSMIDEIKHLQENLERVKVKIAEEMEASMINELTVPLDDAFDIKVKLSERTTKKLDKEELATDLGVAVTSIDTKFLLKAVEDGKLSFHRYLQYIFQETKESVSVRRTKAQGRPSKN